MTITESIAAEIDHADLHRRFVACQALETTIWSHGLQACANVAERIEWQALYADHVRRLSAIYPETAKRTGALYRQSPGPRAPHRRSSE